MRRRPRNRQCGPLNVDGPKGISTFYGFYVLQALAKSGDTDTALDFIRTYWGAMLDLGATTFWEDFNLDWIPNAARIDELVPPGKKGYPWRLRRLLLRRLPPQPLPRLGQRPHRMAQPACPRCPTPRTRLQTRPHRPATRQPPVGRRHLSHTPRPHPRPPRTQTRRHHRLRYQGAGGCPGRAPSRCVLLTGKHLGHAEIRGNRQAKVAFPAFAEGQHPLSESAVTFAELFRDAGYATAAIGKWGLGPVGSTGDPTAKASTCSSATTARLSRIAITRRISGATRRNSASIPNPSPVTQLNPTAQCASKIGSAIPTRLHS
jgi:hypothetical protein